MTAALSNRQIEQYQRKGYLFPLQILHSQQAPRALLDLEQACREARARGLEAELPKLLRTNTHLIMPFVCELAATPALLDKVESILGPDILLWSAEFFIKRANSDKIVSWHQDLTYWGLGETDDEMTAWIALSEVTTESGCMRFMPGSHQQRILPHRDTFDKTNLLSRGQEVAVDVDEDDAVDVILKPGQASFHHGRIFHASGPNRADYDRIGLVYRFITPRVKQLVAERDYAMPMRGRDDSANWIHLKPPTRNFDAQDLELYARVKRDQSAALAEGIDMQQMHAAYP